MNRAVPADELERFRALPIFSELGETGLRRVQGLVTELQITAGQTLVHADDPGAGLFVLEEGTVVVEGRGKLAIEVEAPEFVGELALLVPEATRSARVRAQTNVRCLAIGANDFRQLIQDEPRVALAMLPVVCERLWRARRDG
jgi:CRP/FNR family transcriptional regulator, cyclic AMP receptor protein